MRLSRSGVLARTGVRQGFVIGEPAEVLDRFVQLLIVERAAETFLARGLRDAQRDDAADVAELAEAGVEAAWRRVVRGREFRERLRRGEEHGVGDAARFADQHT